MNSSFIVFRYSDSEFAVPLEQYYTILKPHEMYLYPLKRVNDVYEVLLKEKRVKILDLSKMFSLRTTKATLESRFLIGEVKNEFYGFWVDQVEEIINLKNEMSCTNEIDKKYRSPDKFMLDNKEYNLFNLEKLINNQNIN